MEISALSNNPYVVNIFPEPEKISDINDVIQSILPSNDLFDTISAIQNAQMELLRISAGVDYGKASSLDYVKYLQQGNPRIKALAMSIVSPWDSNDTKMYKLEQWVINNIDYVSDWENYGQDEYWAYPTQTLDRMSGDCEDGAFLLHSLALAAGVPAERLRTYGGLVFNPYGTQAAGHGWTSYQRESDDEWIVMDWCYWPEDSPVGERTPMTEALKYIDDFFFVSAKEGTVETPYSNRVRYAMGDLVNIFA